ncbi:tyrosine-type recombinase/integrase, partial [Roseinatronobacter sp.]
MGIIDNMFRKLQQKEHVSDKSKQPPMMINLSRFFDERYFPHVKLYRRRPELDRYVFDLHIRPVLGDYLLTELDNSKLEAWAAVHVQKGYAPATINKHIFLMNRMMNLARHWGMITHNAFEARVLRRLPVTEQRHMFLKPEEVGRILRACQQDIHPQLYHFTRLLLLTGARKGEALKANWNHFDLSRKVWTVPVSKNGRARRIVLNQAVIDLIIELKAEAEVRGYPLHPNSPVFYNPRTKDRYDSFYAAWHRARAKAEIPDVRFHDLRHTFASLLINEGVSLYEVQRLLGH